MKKNSYFLHFLIRKSCFVVTSDKNYVNRLFKIQNMANNLFLNGHVKKITYFAFLYHVEKVVFFLLQNFLNPTISLFRKKIFMLRWNDPGKFFKISPRWMPELCWNFVMKNLPGHFIQHKTCIFEEWHMMITHQRKAPFQKDSQIFCAREL